MRGLTSPEGHITVTSRLGRPDVAADGPGAIALDVAAGPYITIRAAAWNDLVELIESTTAADLIVRI